MRNSIEVSFECVALSTMEGRKEESEKSHAMICPVMVWCGVVWCEEELRCS